MKASGIITLLTDFGLSDPYAAMIKGVILSINPGARIVDITHQIDRGSIHQAARIIRETYRYFPERTVHLAVVDPGVGSDRRLIALEADGHLFVGPDNGLFWPVIEVNGPATVVQLTESRFFLPDVTHTFHGRDVFAPVAAYLSLGTDVHSLGREITDAIKITFPSPCCREGMLWGQIIRVDHFGNLITNIEAEELSRYLGTAQPVIHVGQLTVEGLGRIYADVEEGRPMALINSSGLLEIAVNMGKASDYVGIERGEIQGSAVLVKKS
ncbi:MAG: SAM-dependent chlorinase/fluorinase [Deltaproteobacteria bacterium]|nr:SAM-dependent chlorinase/fluorinase [Deltaproteobacteria bacterium]